MIPVGPIAGLSAPTTTPGANPRKQTTSNAQKGCDPGFERRRLLTLLAFITRSFSEVGIRTQVGVGNNLVTQRVRRSPGVAEIALANSTYSPARFPPL